jgi:hypothetical protein
LPRERRIEFRVGIHLGDVVKESGSDLTHLPAGRRQNRRQSNTLPDEVGGASP